MSVLKTNIIKNFLSPLLLVFLLIHCYAKVESNFNIEQWEGLDLDGNLIILKNLNYKRIALNVYSQTCKPCIEEIPTLNYLDSEIRKDKSIKLFLVVDPYDITEKNKTESFSSVYPLAVKIMQEEKIKRSIQSDILIMKPPFTISPPPEQGLITGRPETLLLKTNPLLLYYNFIGPISISKNIQDIQKEAKVLFFLKMLGGF
jgi:thiol-disulfide isomerase/thioredoxin